MHGLRSSIHSPLSRYTNRDRVEEGPSRYANGDRLPKQSRDNHARTAESDYGAGLDVTDATDNPKGRRRRWFDLRPTLGPYLGLAESEYNTWWPV
jgi:hypothetical protein